MEEVTKVAGTRSGAELASEAAANWCKTHPSWIRICDMPDGYCDTLYVQWHELSATQQRHWNTEDAYNEYAIKRCKVKYGHITDSGEFASTTQPMLGNTMMVFRIGVRTANALRTTVPAAATAGSNLHYAS
ncbi:hypothetical protein PSR30_04485 [Pectobacterium carotovorum subsp. carotovorum]|uniref:hypothetical protein n=1 Tax=Pectobacterium TaxID=122277 RepID=UPI00137436F7|nr:MULTISPECIES: hypothetical protein [Pectobacterium]QHP82791.1 hypothetical protein EO763_23135 [Pectobacterium odoriferum]WDF99833.1 hypothetical protein PSR30_04485 [Pectobacterium carotovorum subsp. carotovorum]